MFSYPKRFSAAFQLMTSQMALKYSALRFSYWRLAGKERLELVEDQEGCFGGKEERSVEVDKSLGGLLTNKHVPKHRCLAVV